MSRIVLGIIGAGRIVRQGYVTILPRVGCIGEVVLYDLDEAKCAAVIEEYDRWRAQRGVAEERLHPFVDAELHSVASVDEVLRRSDAALVTTPPNSHLEVAQVCLDAGLLTLVEKPLAVSSVAAREFARRNESVLERVRYLENYAHNPAFRRIKLMIDDGTFGSPLLISVFLAKPVPSDLHDGWRLNPHFSGGGVLSDWGSHTFGLALYLAGEGCEVVSVKAEAVHFLPATSPPVESYALTSVFAKSKSGRPLSLLVENSWECGPGQSRTSGFSVSIALTGGTIQIEQRITGQTKDYLIRTSPHHGESTSACVAAEFTNDSLYYSLVEGLQPSPSPYTSYSFGLQILDIIRESRGGEYG